MSSCWTVLHTLLWMARRACGLRSYKSSIRKPTYEIHSLQCSYNYTVAHDSMLNTYSPMKAAKGPHNCSTGACSVNYTVHSRLLQHFAISLGHVQHFCSRCTHHASRMGIMPRFMTVAQDRPLIEKYNYYHHQHLRLLERVPLKILVVLSSFPACLWSLDLAAKLWGVRQPHI